MFSKIALMHFHISSLNCYKLTASKIVIQISDGDEQGSLLSFHDNHWHVLHRFDSYGHGTVSFDEEDGKKSRTFEIAPSCLNVHSFFALRGLEIAQQVNKALVIVSNF